MENHHDVLRHFTITAASGAVIAALCFMLIMSLIKEPKRKAINAVIVAGAGGVYWSGGLGIWEYIFGAVMLMLAFKGLKHYYFIGIGWLLHTGWDVLHYFYGTPIISFAPLSSAGCAVCDAVLALWFFAGAPAVFSSFRKNTLITH